MEVSCAQNSYNISKTSAKGTGIHLRIENASLGSKYYIKISNFSGLTGGNYYLTVNQDIKDAWYGQFYSTLGSVDYWNPNGLDTVKFNMARMKDLFLFKGMVLILKIGWREHVELFRLQWC